MENLKMTEKANEKLGEKYYKIKHKSGLDIYVIPKNHGTSYALFTTKFGSRDHRFRTGDDEEFFDVPDGTAHFLEHKLFDNENGENADMLLAANGANANAFTGSDRTAYLFSATEKIYESLELLLKFVTNPYFTDESVAKEQGIIGQEIRMYEDLPGWRVYFGMLQAMYTNNPVRIDTAGTVETIATITKETLYKCYKTFYNLNNMNLCLCGQFEPEKVAEIADRLLTKSKKITIEREQPDEPRGVKEKSVSCRLRVSRPMFMIGIKENDFGTGKANMKTFAQDEILAECMYGKSSSFFCELYEKGVLNASFSAGCNISDTYAYLALSGEADDPEQILKLVKKNIRETLKKGISEDDFTRAKRVIYAGAIRCFDSTEEIAGDFSAFLLSGNDMFDYPETVSAVTLADINKRAASLLKDEHITMSAVYDMSSAK